GDKLLPMGVGISDAFDALVCSGAAAEPLLLAALSASDAACCDLPELPPGAVLREVSAPPGWRPSEWDGPPSPVLPLARDLRATIPRSMHRDLRQARNRADRMGGWTIAKADPET